MGDFNSSPDSHTIKNLGSRHYSNTKRFIAVQDFNKDIYNHSTMSKFNGNEKGLHIDYIFVSEEFSINHVEIVKYNKEGKYPSDHYPIVASLSL